MIPPLLEVRGLEKSYDEGRIEALRGVDLAIRAGEYVARVSNRMSKSLFILQSVRLSCEYAAAPRRQSHFRGSQ